VPVTGSIYPLTSSWAINAINLKGGTITSSGALINGNLKVNGSAIFFSASYIYVTSSQFIVGDNIITLNANSPAKRFAGIEMNDSGSSAKSSLLWDSLGNYFFISGSTTTNSQNKLIIGPSNNVDLTTNYVTKATAGNTLGNSVIFDNGNVGIGTNAPAQRLDLSGSLRIRSAGTYSDPTDNAGFLNYDSTGGIFTISARSNGGSTFMAFRTSNSGTAGERMRIINDGNVGIGSSSPAYKLDVNGNANFTNGFYTNTDASSTSYFVGANGTRPIIFQNNTGAAYDFGFKFYDANTLSIVGGNTLANPTTDLVVFKYDGNVGIGTTSPANKLSVISGSTRIASTALAGALYLGSDTSLIYLQRDNNYDLSLVQNGDSNSALYLASAGNVYVNIDSNNNDTDKAFIVQNNALKAGTELFRVSETGNVGIGTSTPTQLVDAYKSFNGDIVYQVTNPSVGASATAQFFASNGTTKSQFFHTGTSFVGTGVTNYTGLGGIYNASTGISLAAAGASGVILFGTGTSQTEKMRIASDGNIGIGTISPAYKLQVSGSIAPVGDNKHPIGNSSNRFSDVFAVQTTIGGLFETGLRTTDLGLCETGTVVSWKIDKCVPCEVEEDELVMGVVKNGKDEPLILGAEPILVTGKVEVGDYIVTSNKKGHGKAIKRGSIFKKDLFGKVIAQALQSGEGESYAIKAMIRKM
jgi:hypothetical protein